MIRFKCEVTQDKLYRKVLRLCKRTLINVERSKEATSEWLEPEIADAITNWAFNQGPTPSGPVEQSVNSIPAMPSQALRSFRSEIRLLEIYPDRVELCGIQVWSDRGVSDLREALIMLSGKKGGGYAHLSGPNLMQKLGRDESNPIGRPIKDFCDKATLLLAQHRGLECGRYDIIDSRGGYHFTDWIEVRIIGDEAHEAHGAHDEAHHKAHEAHGHEPHEPHKKSVGASLEKSFSNVPPEQSSRLVKICEALAKKPQCKEDLRRLSGVSRAQTTRDLKVLDDRRLLLKAGPQKERVYSLKRHP